MSASASKGSALPALRMLVICLLMRRLFGATPARSRVSEESGRGVLVQMFSMKGKDNMGEGDGGGGKCRGRKQKSEVRVTK